MPFDWSEYLVLAKELSTRADEASWRTAISRAYYAAYWHARLGLNDEANISSHPGNKHDYVWQFYWSSNNKSGESIGKNGKTLSGHRAAADYKAAIAITKSTAEIRIRQAEILIDDINRLES